MKASSKLGFSVEFFYMIMKNTLQGDDSISILKTTHDNTSMKDFQFPIPPEMLLDDRPRDKTVNKFIRDCVACLQACYGSTNMIPVKTLTAAARKICDKVPLLKDPKPPSFLYNDDREFPYWVKYNSVLIHC